jgi:hypothetical protein
VLWEGYNLGLQTLALDMMHADFDLVTGLLGPPQHGPGHRHRRAWGLLSAPGLG